MRQNSENLKSFILEITLDKGQIKDISSHGFMDSDEGLHFFDIRPELQRISDQLMSIENVDEYNYRRNLQFIQTLEDKFGKRDLKWLMTRLNYYSLGAYLTAIPRRKRYQKEYQKFMNEVLCNEDCTICR